MPIITVIGDGQLARMMQTSAIELGLSLRVFAGNPDSSAAQVAADNVFGDYKNLEDLEKVTDGSVITFDHEHVPTSYLEQLQTSGVNIHPGPQALVYAQDKLAMRKKLRELGAPVPPFAALEAVADAAAFWEAVQGQVCLKAIRGGYDGHGVWFPDTLEEFEAILGEQLSKGVACMAEQKVALVRELSAMVARRPSGETRTWPVVESVQTDGICTEAVAPAPSLDPELADRAKELAITIATELDVTGVLAVELFEIKDELGQSDIRVNELAMRPHNTGHWSQDGSITGQFEQHLRAVLDWPLGSTDTRAPFTVMANVLGAPEDPAMPLPQRMQEVWQRFPEVKIHFYGKTYRAGRKLGHVNVCGSDAERTREVARLAAGFLRTATWSDEQ